MTVKPNHAHLGPTETALLITGGPCPSSEKQRQDPLGPSSAGLRPLAWHAALGQASGDDGTITTLQELPVLSAERKLSICFTVFDC